MSEDSSSTGSASKSFLERLGSMFQAEPQDVDDLVQIVQSARDREVLSADTAEMFEGVLSVSNLRVRDVMIPRSQMVTLDINADLDALLPTVLDSAHSRFPVVNDDKDHVAGILLAKDLLAYGFGRASADFCIADILRPAVIVPESKRVEIMLKEFRSDRYHMAIVVDEYGGVSGLVTIEDILELIVGEIEDETDDEEDVEIRRISDSLYAVKALMSIEDFNDVFGCSFSDDEFDTVGGLVVHAFGHVPNRGETVTIKDFRFKVAQASRRRLEQLHVRIPEDVTPRLDALD